MTVLYIFCFFSWLPFFDGEIKLYKTISASQLRWPDEDVAYRRVYCTLVFALQLQTQNPPVLTTSSAVYRLPEPSSSDCCLGLLTEFTSADGRVPYEAVCRRTSKSVGRAAIVFFRRTTDCGTDRWRMLIGPPSHLENGVRHRTTAESTRRWCCCCCCCTLWRRRRDHDCSQRVHRFTSQWS